MKGILCTLIHIFHGLRNDKSNENYTFGLKEAVKARKLLRKKKFAKLDEHIRSLNVDNLTHVVDCLSLSSEENQLLEFLEKSENKHVPNLVFGAYYTVQGWLVRGHSYASEVSDDDQMEFYNYIELAIGIFEEVSVENSTIGNEALAKLVGNSNAISERENAQEYFEALMSRDKNHASAHLAYASFIQPKWGGSYELIADFLNDIKSKSDLVQHLSELRLLTSAIGADENYFGAGVDDLHTYIKQRVVAIDKRMTQHPPSSIHRYTIYATMYMLADELGLGNLAIKYSHKMNGYFSISAYGVERD